MEVKMVRSSPHYDPKIYTIPGGYNSKTRPEYKRKEKTMENNVDKLSVLDLLYILYERFSVGLPVPCETGETLLDWWAAKRHLRGLEMIAGRHKLDDINSDKEGK